MAYTDLECAIALRFTLSFSPYPILSPSLPIFTLSLPPLGHPFPPSTLAYLVQQAASGVQHVQEDPIIFLVLQQHTLLEYAAWWPHRRLVLSVGIRIRLGKCLAPHICLPLAHLDASACALILFLFAKSSGSINWDNNNLPLMLLFQCCCKQSK